MKTPALLFSLLLLACSMAFSGCQTRPQTDWAARVGNFTFDQAVKDYGPPDKSTKLSDGSLVAEWRQARNSPRISIGIGTGYVGRHTAVGVGQTVHTGGGSQWLRLTFAPDGTLRAHEFIRR